MPLVRLYGEDHFEREGEIRKIVAEELSCEMPDGSDGTIDPDEGVELFTYDIFGGVDEGHMTVDLLVEIEAINYPDRVATRKERGERIKARVSELFGNAITVAVFLKTVDADWCA